MSHFSQLQTPVTP